MSQKYAFKDWVAPVDVNDRDGIKAKKKRLVPCKFNDPKKRHRATKNDSLEITTGYIICWVGILIHYGSLGTSKSPQNLWKKMPYGIYAP